MYAKSCKTGSVPYSLMISLMHTYRHTQIISNHTLRHLWLELSIWVKFVQCMMIIDYTPHSLNIFWPLEFCYFILDCSLAVSMPKVRLNLCNICMLNTTLEVHGPIWSNMRKLWGFWPQNKMASEHIFETLSFHIFTTQ